MTPPSKKTPAPPSRETLRGHIEAHPGCTMSHLRQATGLAWATLHHHVERLVAAGQVRRLAAGRHRLLFGAGSPAEPHAILAGSLRDGRAILEAILCMRQATTGELVRRLGAPRSALRRQLRTLQGAGLVLDEGSRRPRYVLSAAGRHVADAFPGGLCGAPGHPIRASIST